MKAILFIGDQAGALAMQARMSTACGYPIDGQNIGGGVHATRAQGRTVHYGAVIRHPARSADYAVVCHGFDSSRLQTGDRTLVDSAQDLTADWFPTLP